MSAAIDPRGDAQTTKIRSTAAVMFCLGCCCGKTERGLPAVPVERLKSAWKAEKLNRAVQLTISGCLGPCDVPNVAVIVTPGETLWYGKLDGDAPYEAIIAWARERVASGLPLPPPEALDSLRLLRFRPEPEPQAGPLPGSAAE